MASVASVTTTALLDLLTAETSGVTARLWARLRESDKNIGELVTPRIIEGNVAAETFDKAQGGKYPQIVVFCERVKNAMAEKFNRFSGTADLVVEVRHSQDRIEELEQRTQLFTEAVLSVLEDSRGEWAQGVYYTGEYEVKFEQVKHGGRNLLQTARVKVPVTVRIN